MEENQRKRTVGICFKSPETFVALLDKFSDYVPREGFPFHFPGRYGTHFGRSLSHRGDTSEDMRGRRTGGYHRLLRRYSKSQSRHRPEQKLWGLFSQINHVKGLSNLVGKMDLFR